MHHTQRSKQERLHPWLCSAALRDEEGHSVHPGGSMQAGVTSSSVPSSELAETADRRMDAPLHLYSSLIPTTSCPANQGKGREPERRLHLFM